MLEHFLRRLLICYAEKRSKGKHITSHVETNKQSSGRFQHIVNHIHITLEFNRCDFYKLKFLFQFDCKFLICLLPSNKLLVLVDQHACDERIRYERLQEQLNEQSMKIPVLLSPPLKLNDVNFTESITELAEYGFLFDKTIQGLFLIAVPKFLWNKGTFEVSCPYFSGSLLILEFLDNFQHTTIVNGIPLYFHNYIKSIACKGKPPR